MITDFLIRLKNASLAKNKVVEVKKTKINLAVALALKTSGYLSDVKDDKGVLTVNLSYKNKMPVLRSLKLVSKPGLRVYKSIAEIEKHKSPSIFLISTPKGILNNKEAVKQRLGGEVLVEVW